MRVASALGKERNREIELTGYGLAWEIPAATLCVRRAAVQLR
jgi:hypothetical protein